MKEEYLHIRISKEEKELFKKAADELAEGSLSMMVRIVVKKFLNEHESLKQLTPP